ncbi:PREDICTED: NADH dehydrogenase [ubiquinone] 1 beta subcomplex subunit 3 [Eufriesea mexicana]|uniref:NADH dehydrogenase [ubiquinone] 1 beta subcomplex subunit 3 n=1 Tax=Eufriesea mexicana TaxID=516756 RepID=UPI00083C339D|nr:PREDICTED: NADH dehydrogenase [ubiquinone] 1 beta subcomplex subunit 3 [Eufriesea mexicana]
MGGHGGQPKIPNPDIYKVEDVPELKLVQEKLSEHGLKDPWLRNEVWRYTGIPGNHRWLAFRILTRGMVVGFAAFLVTIGIERSLGITYETTHGHGHDGHDDHDDHDDHGHH